MTLCSSRDERFIQAGAAAHRIALHPWNLAPYYSHNLSFFYKDRKGLLSFALFTTASPGRPSSWVLAGSRGPLLLVCGGLLLWVHVSCPAG